ncbi:hypothetical protein BD413DRAFT_629352 [Trametes elegans]|nr:hypothetical protein BD413DRAFT_629352 [Trametes elegans]
MHLALLSTSGDAIVAVTSRGYKGPRIALLQHTLTSNYRTPQSTRRHVIGTPKCTLTSRVQNTTLIRRQLQVHSRRNLSAGYDSPQSRARNVSDAYRPPSPPESSPPPGASPEATEVTARFYYLEFIRKAHPGMQPQNDFELVTLGSDWLWGLTTREQKREWLAYQWAEQVAIHGGADVALQRATALADTPGECTGRKPLPGEPNVTLIPLHNSGYAMRLWPGSFTAAEYCLDFVKKSTGEAVRTPPGYALWFVPDPSTPWLQGSAPVELVSLERGHGIPEDEILEGEEKFVLRDGMNCVLRRPGCRDARFTMPLRPRAETPYDDMDVLAVPPFQ